MAVIEAHEATIQTAAVQVRTLTVSGKQVTLALFRQLREEPLEDPEDGALQGELWGTVNYHPDKCGDDKRHLHVVWQLGDELRRARAKAPRRPGQLIGGRHHGPQRPWVRFCRESTEEWLAAAVLSGWRPERTVIDDDGRTQYAVVQFSHVVAIPLEGESARFLSAKERLEMYGPQPRNDWERDQAAKARAAVAEAEANLMAQNPPTLDKATECIEDELRVEDERHARRQANWERVQALPQLFIAV